jgi:hypothetical protein
LELFDNIARSAIPVYFDLIILVFFKTFIFSSTSADESTDHPLTIHLKMRTPGLLMGSEHCESDLLLILYNEP